MADSDEDYVNSSGDEVGAHIVSRGGRKGARPPTKGKKTQKKEAWEDIKRSWDNVVEGADGSLDVAGLLDAGKRKRFCGHTTRTDGTSADGWKAAERHNTPATRHHQTCHARIGSFDGDGREGL